MKRIRALGQRLVCPTLAIALVSAIPAIGYAQSVLKQLETGAQNLGKAAADVVTLGEEGRRRDRERAEAAAAAAREAAAAKERERNQKIAALNDSISLLNAIIANLDTNIAMADEVTVLHDQIVRSGEAELLGRSKADVTLEKAADGQRKSQSDLVDLMMALESLTFIDDQLIAAAQSQQGELKDANLQKREQALATLRNLGRTSQLGQTTSSAYFDQALKSIKTDSLKATVQGSVSARTAVVSLRTTLVEQRKGYVLQIEGKKKELGALGVKL